MARKRTAPRKRRATTAPKAQAAPQAPAAPSDRRLTDQALRAHVRKSKAPIFNILAPFGTIKEEVEDKMEQVRGSMR